MNQKSLKEQSLSQVQDIEVKSITRKSKSQGRSRESSDSQKQRDLNLMSSVKRFQTSSNKSSLDQENFHLQEQNESERKLFNLISQNYLEELGDFLQSIRMDLREVWDRAGFNLLHLAGYKNSLQAIQFLISYQLLYQMSNEEQKTQRTQQIIQEKVKKDIAIWINIPSPGYEGFTVTHFGAFYGNNEMLEYLFGLGADQKVMYHNSSSKISLLHVAAQGDHPSTIAFLKKIDKNSFNINHLDANNSTPLHWACYSSAESAIQYLIAWGAEVNAQDYSGLSPLHIAVQSSEEVKSARSVRLLLIKGADRNSKDIYDRKPIHIAKSISIPNLRKELIQHLKEPTLLQKLMIQTPLKKVQRSRYSLYMFLLMFLISFTYLITIIYPGMKVKINICIDEGISIHAKLIVISVFIATMIFFLLSWLTDPGYIVKSENIDFVDIIQNFDPTTLCPDCEVIKTQRCRHCNVCKRCVERFDHHCPWIDNCIGYKNHGYFYAYIIFMITYMVMIFFLAINQLQKLQSEISISSIRLNKFMILQAVLGYKNSHFEQNVLVRNVSSILMLLLCLVFLIPLLILVCVQTKNMITNETTSERLGKKKESASDIFKNSNQIDQKDHELLKIIKQEEEVNVSSLSQISNMLKNCYIMGGSQVKVESQEELLAKKKQI